MRFKSLFVTLLTAISSVWMFVLPLQAKADVYVNGYYRNNGTWVDPYYRSDPNGNPYDNWSFPGNENPYTGKIATGNPETYLENYYNRSDSDYSYTPSHDTYDSSYAPSDGNYDYSSSYSSDDSTGYSGDSSF